MDQNEEGNFKLAIEGREITSRSTYDAGRSTHNNGNNGRSLYDEKKDNFLTDNSSVRHNMIRNSA